MAEAIARAGGSYVLLADVRRRVRRQKALG